jgi:hypothetical protein
LTTINEKNIFINNNDKRKKEDCQAQSLYLYTGYTIEDYAILEGLKFIFIGHPFNQVSAASCESSVPDCFLELENRI